MELRELPDEAVILFIIRRSLGYAYVFPEWQDCLYRSGRRWRTTADAQEEYDDASRALYPFRLHCLEVAEVALKDRQRRAGLGRM